MAVGRLLKNRSLHVRRKSFRYSFTFSSCPTDVTRLPDPSFTVREIEDTRTWYRFLFLVRRGLSSEIYSI